MQPRARLRLPDGSLCTLVPGDLIGRTHHAALFLDHPEVSEAHAMLSLRGERLWLLALRRRFVVGERPLDALALSCGQRIRLARDLEISVEDLTLPESVLGLEGPGFAACVLADTSSLCADPQPRLRPGIHPHALASFWATDAQWRVQVGAEVRPLAAGDALPAPLTAWRAVPIALSDAGQSPTRVSSTAPLRLVVSFDTVQIHTADAPVVLLSGQFARVLTELAVVRQPLPWQELAAPLWPHLPERDVLRRRWDGLLSRMRDRLHAEGIRRDLVRSSNVGLVELILCEGDQIEDRS